MDHNLEWIDHISNEIIRQEFDDMIFQMRLHGVPKKQLDTLQNEFDDDTESQPKNIRIPISQFDSMGLAFARDNKTRVIRGKK